MQKTVLGALVCALLALWIVPASAAGSNGTAVSVYQYGVLSPTNTVQVGNPFTMVGTGFRTGTTAKICLTGQYPCLVVDVDNSGSFSLDDILYYTGTYLVDVYQKSRSGRKLDHVYSGSLTVVN
jgi:hypothetical protein